MTAAELRAEAKILRKRAKECEHEADALDLAAQSERRRATNREALEAKAATMCRPVWKMEALDGVYVVVNVEKGCFMVRDLRSVDNHPPHPYRTRDGRYGGGFYGSTAVAVHRAQLDHVATMINWRAWCASRKSSDCAVTS